MGIDDAAATRRTENCGADPMPSRRGSHDMQRGIPGFNQLSLFWLFRIEFLVHPKNLFPLQTHLWSDLIVLPSRCRLYLMDHVPPALRIGLHLRPSTMPAGSDQLCHFSYSLSSKILSTNRSTIGNSKRDRLLCIQRNNTFRHGLEPDTRTKYMEIRQNATTTE